MAQASKERISKELVSLLKTNDKGWMIDLFEDKNKISEDYLCGSCKSVCCDAVELGCDHDDNDILLYCDMCLKQLIKDNDNNCPINSHSDAVIVPSRSSRRKIAKSMVMCPYSIQYHQRQEVQCKNNDNGQVIDTIGGDEKEGVAAADGGDNAKNKNINIDGCQWKGTLNDLLTSVHLSECVQNFDPSFTQNVIINDLKTENEKLNVIITAQRKQIDELQNRVKSTDTKLVQLQQQNQLKTNQLEAIKKKLNDKNSEYDSLRMKSKQEHELINKLEKENETIHNKVKEQFALIQDLMNSKKYQQNDSKVNEIDEFEFVYPKDKVKVDGKDTLIRIGDGDNNNITVIGSWIESSGKKIVTLSLKINKQGCGNSICIGVVGVEYNFNKHIRNCRSGYAWEGDGCVWKLGGSVSVNANKMHQGDTISVTLDCSKSSMSYIINNGKSKTLLSNGKLKKSAEIRYKFGVTMRRVGDSVTILKLESK